MPRACSPPCIGFCGGKRAGKPRAASWPWPARRRQGRAVGGTWGGTSIGVQPQQRGQKLRDGCTIAASLCAVLHWPNPQPCSHAKPCTQGARAEGVPPAQRPLPGQPCRVCERLAAAALQETRQGRGKVRRPWPLRGPPRQQRAARGLPQPCVCFCALGAGYRVRVWDLLVLTMGDALTVTGLSLGSAALQCKLSSGSAFLVDERTVLLEYRTDFLGLKAQRVLQAHQAREAMSPHAKRARVRPARLEMSAAASGMPARQPCTNQAFTPTSASHDLREYPGPWCAVSQQLCMHARRCHFTGFNRRPPRYRKFRV